MQGCAALCYGVSGPAAVSNPRGRPRFWTENLAPLRWGFCLGALPRCVQPTLRLGVEVVGLPTWKAGKPVWHNMTDLAPSPLAGLFLATYPPP